MNEIVKALLERERAEGLRRVETCKERIDECQADLDRATDDLKSVLLVLEGIQHALEEE